MISSIKKHLFGILISIATIAIVFGVYCFYGKAILHDYEETQICHEIDNVLNEYKLGESDAPDKILEKALKLYNVQQKFKDFKFMRTVHQNRYNKLNDAIRSYLISYYELPYKGKDLELVDINEYVNTVQNAIKDIDEKKRDVKKTIDNLDPQIGENLKQIDIELIKTTLEKIEALLTEKSDTETSPEKSQADISAKESVIAAAEEGSNNAVPAANKENNDWQKGFIVKEQKKDKDGNSIKDSNGNNVYAAIEDFEFIKNKLFQICALHEKFNELTNKNVDTAIIDNLKKCKSFKESLKYIDSQKTNEATTKKAAEILGNKISEENDIASILSTLDNIESLDKEYVNVICEHIKTNINNSFIHNKNFNNSHFEKLYKNCTMIIKKKKLFEGQALETFANAYRKWFDGLKEKDIVYKFNTFSSATTEYPLGARIIVFHVAGASNNYKAKYSFGEKIESFKSFPTPSPVKFTPTSCAPLIISVEYYLCDGNMTGTHSKPVVKVIYPLLHSIWTFSDELQSDNDKKNYKTIFNLVVENENKYETFVQLFGRIFKNKENTESFEAISEEENTAETTSSEKESAIEDQSPEEDIQE